MATPGATKVDLIAALKQAFGYRHYLELTTPTTGGRYAEVRSLAWDACHRLVYRNTGVEHADGLPVDFASPDEDISLPLAEIGRRRLTYDIALVDAHHTYHCTARDLRAIYRLVRRGGALVVHDCWPRDANLASPRFVSGPWCGVTYRAYLDFVLGNPRLDYCTVDTDYGCGIILKSLSPVRWARNIARAARQMSLAQQWSRIGPDHDDAFDFLCTHYRALLRLVDLELFARKLRAGM